MFNEKKAREIIDRTIKVEEENSEGRGKYCFKRFVKYNGKMCAEVYSFLKEQEPTEDDIELWGIDFETGDAGLICE